MHGYRFSTFSFHISRVQRRGVSMKNEFPLFNRIAILVMSSGFLIVLLIGLASPKFRNDLDVVNGFVFAVFAFFACFGVWVSLFWKNQTRQELEQDEAFISPEQPDIPDGALACRFSTGVKSASVSLDVDSGLIHFRDCHVPRRFLASAQPWFSCTLTDVKGVHVFRYRGESLTIVTAGGKALIPATATNYTELREMLDELVPFSQPGFSTDHPMMGMVYLAGALMGIFLGAFLTPRNSSDSTMGLFVLAGAVLGVVASYLLVFAGDRCLKTGLAQPIGFGMAGVCFGVALSSLLGRFIGWSSVPMIALVLVCGALGFVFGVRRQSREEIPSTRSSPRR